MIPIPCAHTAETVLPGHPDKLCDAAVDAVVHAVAAADPGGQVGLEAALLFDRLLLTGRIAAAPEVLDTLDLQALARSAFADAGYGPDAAGHPWRPAPDDVEVRTVLCLGPFEPGERDNRHLSDDQAICVGYAVNDPDTGFLPPAHWLARRVARRLFDLRRASGAGQAGPDGKVLVRLEPAAAGWTLADVSISLHHHPGSDWIRLQRLADEAVRTSLPPGLGAPPTRLNGAGMFIAGGPNGDNGLSGKKLVCDAYGPTVPIGGGAWSGKDLHKVDRLGGLLARRLALHALDLLHPREALVTLTYTPGCDRPDHIDLTLDGRPASTDDLRAVLHDQPLENRAAFEVLRPFEALAADGLTLPDLARWGHHQPRMPWEAPRPADRPISRHRAPPLRSQAPHAGLETGTPEPATADP